MSKSLKTEIRQATRGAGGATLTKVARENNLKAFVRILKNDLNIQLKSFENLKASQVQKYVDHLKEKGISDRTIQNKLAHIRSALEEKGRGHFAHGEKLSNATLGVAGASRDGTHTAITEEKFIQARNDLEKTSPGAAAALSLQKTLGLRAQEAIKSPESLKHWQKSLEKGTQIHVIHGTKGGKSRMVEPVDREKALEAIKTALEAVKAQEGRLIPSSSLEGALRAYQRSCQSVGLEGKLASHSLRLNFAQAKFAQYIERGMDRKEALAACSLDLGHGDGRGTYVAQVYLK
jgi:site-specific recombinase XerD